MKKYTNPMDYYKRDKKLEARRDKAVENGFSNMDTKEIYSWANELAEFFQLPKPKFDNVAQARKFIQIYYKR